MPRRPLRPCAEPGCPTLVSAGRCPPHTRQHERRRGSRHERGYDRDHERWRRTVLDRDGYTCQPCFRAKRMEPANIADHVVPFDQGGARLDPANGQAICSGCHAHKTAWEKTHDARTEPWPETEAGWP